MGFGSKIRGMVTRAKRAAGSAKGRKSSGSSRRPAGGLKKLGGFMRKAASGVKRKSKASGTKMGAQGGRHTVGSRRKIGSPKGIARKVISKRKGRTTAKAGLGKVVSRARNKGQQGSLRRAGASSRGKYSRGR